MPTFVAHLGDLQDLGVHVGRLPWGPGTIDVLQESEARRAGLGVGASEDVVTLDAPGVASAEAIAAFVQATSPDRDGVGTLSSPLDPWAAAPGLGGPVRLIRLRGGGVADPERLARAEAVTLVTPSRRLSFRVGDRPSGRDLQLDLGDAVLCPVGHWSGVLWANLLALGPMLWRRLVGPAWRAPASLAWAALRAMSVRPYPMARAISVVERGATVHPSAVVEASWIGAGANVGPHAVVRGSILGPEAAVEPHASVVASVLGRGAVVQRHGWAWFSVLGEGAGVGGAMQLGLLSPGAQLKGGAYLLDQAIGGTVRVLRGGRLHEVPLGMIGVGVGRDSVVGSGVRVGPGRTVPADVVLAPERGVLTRWPPEPGSGVRMLPRPP